MLRSVIMENVYFGSSQVFFKWMQKKKQRAGTCTDLRQLNPFVIFLDQRVTLNYNSGNISGKVT